MLCRWRHKFPSKIPSHYLKSHFFSAQKSAPLIKSLNNHHQQQNLNNSHKPTSLNPQFVQAKLRNCPSDLTALKFFLLSARQYNYFHDKPTFHHMVIVLSNLTQQYGTVKSIVGELEKQGCDTKAQTFLLLMRIYWCGSMYDMVLEAYTEMGIHGYVPNTYARNIRMDVLFRMGRVDLGLKVLEETKVPNFLSFSTAVCNLCKIGDVGILKVVLRYMLMKGFYLNCNTYLSVLNCFCKSGSLVEAMQLLGMMVVVGVPVSVNVWSILIDGFCKGGKIEIAAYLLEKMMETGCSPNIATCTSLIKGFLESSMPEKAFEILGLLVSKGYFPDIVLCNVLIDCLAKMGCYDDAFEVFLSLRDWKLMPDVYTFSSLVSTVCLSRQYDHLPFLISELVIQPDLVAINCLLSYFCKAGLPKEAVEFYDDMIDGGFVPDKYTYAGVLAALFRSGRINDAVKVYKGMMLRDMDIDVCIHTIIVNGLIKSGSIQKAIRLFKQADGEKILLDVVSYNVVIGGLIRYGRVQKAYELFTQMKKMEIAPNKHSYDLILSGFCKDRDMYKVKSLLQEMIDMNIEFDSNTYRLLKNIICDFPDSLLDFKLYVQSRNSRILPGEEQAFVMDGRDDGAYLSFGYFNGARDTVSIGTSSSDELSDAAVSVG